jgi:hypothetical protein
LLSFWPPSPLLRSQFARFQVHKRTVITIIITTITTTTGDPRDAARWMAPLSGAIFLCGVTLLTTSL